MKWLELSLDQFEPIPDIQFSIKKPLFAASFVLKLELRERVLHAFADLRAKIPLKGAIHYSVEAESVRAGLKSPFAFTQTLERDVVGGYARSITASGTRLTVKKSGPNETEKTVDIKNASPAAILSPLFVLPAFQQSWSAEEKVYAGTIVIGSRLQAIRLERKPSRSTTDFTVETYEGKFMHVSEAMRSDEFSKLPWATTKGFEFDWNLKTRAITAARFTVPIIGQLEIRA